MPTARDAAAQPIPKTLRNEFWPWNLKWFMPIVARTPQLMRSGVRLVWHIWNVARDVRLLSGVTVSRL